MKLTCAGTKKSPTYYIQKTIRIGNKTTTKTVERLGNIEEIKARCGDQDPIEWAKEYAKNLLSQKKKLRRAYFLSCLLRCLLTKMSVTHAMQAIFSCRIFIIHLDLIRYAPLFQKNKFDYDLNDILSMLFHSRIIAPGSNLSSLESAQRFLEQPKCELHQVYRALEVIANENDFFQSELYKSSQNVINKKKKSFITTAPTTTLRLKTKMILENMVFPKNTDLTLLFRWVCLWMRIAFHLHSLFLMAIKTEQPSMSPLEQKIIKDFETSDFIVCTDAGLSSTANRKFNSIQGRRFVTTQSIKKLKGFLRNFCLEDDGWHLPGSNKKYKLSELDEGADYGKVFYKDKWINENNLEQHLIVTYSIKYCNYQRTPD